MGVKVLEYRRLGRTDLIVSRLCFGALTIGPLQANLDVHEGAKVIVEALNNGVNFIDTAELYETYEYIRNAIKMFGKRDKVVIASKTYAYTKEGAEKSLKKALNELETDYIDIFLLHEQESKYTIKGHHEAVEYFLKAKEKGYIRAFGISTHTVEAVDAAAGINEIDVIHPLVNKEGLGIQKGTLQDMLDAIKKAYNNGKGIYAMKPLAGGNFLYNIKEAFNFLLEKPYIHSIAVGMKNTEEVTVNIKLFNGEEVSEELLERLKKVKRRLQISSRCIGCGKCAERCSQKAIYIEDGKAKVIEEKCVLCCYCGRVCPDFCIKII